MPRKLSRKTKNKDFVNMRRGDQVQKEFKYKLFDRPKYAFWTVPGARGRESIALTAQNKAC